MWKEIDGVLHMDIAEAAKLTKYHPTTLRRLAREHAFYAKFEGHNWWTTQQAILDYRAQDSRRNPGRRKRGEGAK